jgi:hypothetical protein
MFVAGFTISKEDFFTSPLDQNGCFPGIKCRIRAFGCFTTNHD